MKIKAFLLVIYLSFGMLSLSDAQTKIFEFEDGLCTYKGFYDSKKYTQKQLEDTFSLINTGHYVDDEGSLEDLNKRYAAAIQQLKNLHLLDIAYFKELRVAVLRYLEETHALKQVEKTAKTQPAQLITAVKAGSPAHKYALALNKGGEELLTAYKELVQEQMKNNGAPEYLWDKYQENMRQANKLDIAFDEVLVFGWWNNANQLVHHIDYDGSQMAKFLTIFKQVETDCEEP